MCPGREPIVSLERLMMGTARVAAGSFGNRGNVMTGRAHAN